MSEASKSSTKFELRFQVRSSNPHTSPAELVSGVESILPELQKELGAEYGPMEIRADREKSIPIDWQTAHLVLEFVGKALAGGALAKFGGDVYEFLKKHIKNGSVERK